MQPLFDVPAIPVTQPIGTFYIAAILASDLESICQYDIRRLVDSDNDVDRYLGIQRKIDPNRVKEIAQYVNTIDATFPTSIVIAVDENSVRLLDNNRLEFYENAIGDAGQVIPRGEIARILDGQHRLAGLRASGQDFVLSVTLFASLDIADQAYVFATVNLAQTKVNRSLVYDLFAYAKSRSPQKTAHNVAVALDSADGSPLYHTIKRLGTATKGREETLTQATFASSLLPYLSENPMQDRDLILRGRSLERASAKNFRAMPFRNLFIDDKDDVIADIVWTYFESISNHWNEAWADLSQGSMLRRTNGFRAFMRVLGDAYTTLGGRDAKQPLLQDYLDLWSLTNLTSAKFTVDEFPAGTSGESKLVEKLQAAIRIKRTRSYSVGLT